jgi:tRNA C32,U32 (ribose-2'-O)-methylase TrmJ
VTHVQFRNFQLLDEPRAGGRCYLYELVRDAEIPCQVVKQENASAGEVERITVSLREALLFSGYRHPGSAASTQEKVRRLVRRLRVPASDSDVWLGILRQISFLAR